MSTPFPKKAFATLLAASVCALGLSACGAGAGSSGSGDELRIGLIADITGTTAAIGIPERKTVEYFVDQANKDGGLNGYNVSLHFKDGKSSPTEAAKAARELTTQDKVHVILGPTTGSETLAVGPILKSNRVPALVPIGTIGPTEKGSESYDWIFRTTQSDAQRVDDQVTLMKNRGYKNLAVFYQQDSYGENSTNDLKKALAGTGMRIAVEASSALDASDLTTQATKLAAAKPDVIIVQSSVPTLGAALLRGLHQAGSNAPIIVAGGLTQQAFVDAAGSTAEGVTAVGSEGWDKPSAEQAKFIEGYGQPESYAEALAGTGFLALQAAMDKITGDVTGEKVRDALENTCGFPTLHKGDGCYSADDHDGAFSAAVVELKDGQWVTVQ
ncbi:ABC transporter substrate-binding protein [Gordonia hydrophobica]|uniref:ABC transporter substrate-binding protein n=1 Tax=Gordonia hydrophobica TaxID=40516 RepID=A0ABZ2U7J6_9ACTN|nr:ABC transporter substrate-binding protein [Gordonia hydrophobica]MBM7368651.1 branched-chain amino acid transport system substrate-binding protein [Gordonia hydrophobica]